MAASDDLINFDLIEIHKENIQQLPGGRSAKQLAAILSPVPSARTGVSPTFGETKTLNDAIRQEYENELLSIDDSDDPLDVYDRYVKWTLNAYPSAQATPQSQLLPLLERATKAFLTSSHYKNDPRYLKLWLHYIRLFSDAPRETFAFLARHHIGDGLGLFYEDFATWLEGAGRWNQADEVYKMGIEKEARPTERLVRKYNQFQQRFEARPDNGAEPSSPALPTIRPALAAKIDPFSSMPRSEDAQAQRPTSGGSGARAKSGKPKMAIFSDADHETPPPATNPTNGWDSIGSMKERKKENTVEARSWVGETLKGGTKVGSGTKMEVFKDPNAPIHNLNETSPSGLAAVVNPRTGRVEKVFVNLQAVYPNQAEEYSFEELRAMRRGWTSCDWRKIAPSPMQPSDANVAPVHLPRKAQEVVDTENLSETFHHKTDLHDMSTQSLVGMPESKPTKAKKLKVREVKQVTQTVKLNLDSPTGRKVKRKGSSEPTMTFHSKAATNDIYDMFNQTGKHESKENTQSGDDTDYGDDTYSTAGESAHTGIISGNNSEFGDDTTRSFGFGNTESQPDSVSPWSDFTASKHVPRLKLRKGHQQNDSQDLTDNIDSSQNHTMHTGSFDTQAIEALANQDFDNLDTKMIAHLAGDVGEEDDHENEEDNETNSCSITNTPRDEANVKDSNDLDTPIDEPMNEFNLVEVHEKPRFVPIPPEDYEPTPMRPYRDPAIVAQSKLPYMTPIVERTESSLATSTIFQNKDYYESKTPSRAAKREESPSKLQIDQLLLSSPHSETLSPVKRPSPAIERPCSVDEMPLPVPPLDAPLCILEDEQMNILVPAPKAKLPISADIAESHSDDVFQPAQDQRLVTIAPKATLQAKSTTKPPSSAPHKGPIIPDMQCNPVDPIIQQQILKFAHPTLDACKGFVEYDVVCNSYEALKRFGKRERSAKQSNDTTNSKITPPSLKFSGTDRVYTVKRELGTGAYAAVYLVESHDSQDAENLIFETDKPDMLQPKGMSRNTLEAMKTESPATSLAWEFYVLQLLRSRLGPSARSMQSIVTTHECHLYRDECYLVLDYHSQGTLLDLVNCVRTDNSRAGKNVEGLDESVAMWLSIEVLRTMEDFHKIGVLHGDLKIDNCLARFEPNVELLSPYNRHGDDGWDSKGMMLIDFGRGIDVKAFKPEARFVADWKAEETDCAEIREARPWKWEIDLFGAAGIIHSLLFGKYIETVVVSGGGLGQKKEWKLKETFKRYWEKEIWNEVFHVLINGGGKDVEEIRSEVSRIRVLMEDWLEKEGERGGRDLRNAIRRCERLLGVTVGAGGSLRGRSR